MSTENFDFETEFKKATASLNGEASASVLTFAQMGVFIKSGIKDMEDARESIMEELQDMLDSFTYTQLMTLYMMGMQFKRDYDSALIRKNNREKREITIANKETEIKEKTIYDEGYNNGVIEGIERGKKEAEAKQAEIGFKTAYEKGYKEGFQKGKELRIKELKKMREWE
ncbi:hypothetical protein [Bacillus cereus group sp. MG11]|uniref:hypothetical protein n=1 Tax=Bacillus cereus group sp. MG11 TaxID=3040248 RepID=UPI003390F9CE